MIIISFFYSQYLVFFMLIFKSSIFDAYIFLYVQQFLHKTKKLCFKGHPTEVVPYTYILRSSDSGFLSLRELVVFALYCNNNNNNILFEPTQII